MDPRATAVAVLALEQEPPLSIGPNPEEDEEDEEGGHSSFSASPEEVYVDFVGLPAGLNLRAGQSRQPFGVSNRMHPHDLPWSGSPMPLVNTLGHEGYADVGLNASLLLPLPVALTLSGGVLSGRPLDEAARIGWLGRAEGFAHGGRWDLGVGASAVGTDSGMAVWGSDLMLRWRASSWRSVVLLAEVVGDEQLGGYAALQVQPARTLYLGLRADRYGQDRLYGGYASWYSSEFLRLRVGLLTDGESTLADAQLTFVWGAHPVEPYWVNR